MSGSSAYGAGQRKGSEAEKTFTHKQQLLRRDGFPPAVYEFGISGCSLWSIAFPELRGNRGPGYWQVPGPRFIFKIDPPFSRRRVSGDAVICRPVQDLGERGIQLQNPPIETDGVITVVDPGET